MRRAMLAVLLVMVAVADAAALDQPISARKLTLRRTAGGQEKLAFLTKDPALLFPAIGSADDPATGTPGGVLIELFSEHRGRVAITVPAAVGWFVRDAPAAYKFINKQAPNGLSTVSSLLVKAGRAIRLRGAAVGFGAAGSLGTVGIRITVGSLRSCALFDEITVKRDDGRAYLARNATGAALTDCSDASLGPPVPCTGTAEAPTCGGTCPAGSACATRDLATCECIAAAQPCGDTDPVCSGTCPAGETCGSIGGLPLPTCACLPDASTPCGDTAGLACGGDCSPGLSCYGVSLAVGPVTIDGCQCLPAPPLCSGAGAPVCNGTCPLGLACGDVAGVCVCQ
jgi:hypothetical protein